MSDWSVSDSSDSDGPRRIVRRKARDYPESPFKQFCQHIASNQIINPSDDPDILSPASLEERWDELSNDDREHWEAKFGRTIAEYLKTHDISGPSDRVGRGGRAVPIDRLNQLSLSSNAASESSEPKAPWILHRAELYQLYNKPRYGRGKNVVGAKYVTSIEHDRIMHMNIGSKGYDLESDSLAAFEVTTFLAQPKSAVRDQEALLNLDISGPIKYQGDQPVKAHAEAGEVITIKSKTIIEAVQSIASGYPEYSSQGDTLVVAEPFCFFLRFRQEMLAIRDALTTDQSVLSTSEAEGDPRPGPIRKSDGSSEAGVLKVQQASHITMLYDFIDSRYQDEVMLEQTRWGKPVATCTFEWAWMLFTPGTLVYENALGDSALPRAYVVESFGLGGLFHYDSRDQKPKVNPRWLDSRESRNYQHRLGKIKVTLVYLINDGRRWIPKRKSVVVMPFTGERLITDLKIYPCEYFNDQSGQVKERLIARGKRYHALSTRGLYQYHGQTLSGTRRWLSGRIMVDTDTYHHDLDLTTRSDIYRGERNSRQPRYDTSDSSDSDTCDSDMQPSRRSIQTNSKFKKAKRRSRHVVDVDNDRTGSRVGEGFDEGDNCLPTKLGNSTVQSKKAINRYLENAGLERDLTNDEVYMICDRKLYAYVLDEREWVLLAVEGISDCQFNTEMIHDLQVDQNIKRMILALAHSYSIEQPEAPKEDATKVMTTKSAQPWSSDFVPNKGRGQILLLHGKPGVGKTTAAECVAERTRRPLLSITCGDLGSHSSAVWGELTRWLRLGALWNAVLLFDEADVFLEARTQGGDTNRNSLVSIFLKALEYYQGLIFLTTNRVGTFDEAVVSRIHVILHFPDLSDDDRQRIWDTSFTRLKLERSDVAIDDSVRDQALRDPLIQSLSWNGREIRSAFNNMISLAEWDARETGRLSKDGRVEIRREHLQQVATTSNSFKEYLRSLYGVSEASRVKLHGLRDDDFGTDAAYWGKR